ncbi:hypothetical protein DM860_011749 [Cuscuta australis]|uniref:Uncharacterized protein n=1 Tax=Cuscuta australis TaxID=267555 RepID=A0A328DEZ6_9ASTE|nr:hypothetical protein DM860_011749 [Cuscuta australis]
MGMSMLIPRTVAFNAVQRHTAASRSNRPPSAEQQCGESGGVPTMAPTFPFSKLAHAPNFRTPLGQCPSAGFGFGFVLWGQPVVHPLTRVKKSRVVERNRASESGVFESIGNGWLYSDVWFSLGNL